MRLRIATWNIAAARKLLSANKFDYSKEEEIDYFADQLNLLKLDVVCLQESHANTTDSLSVRLSELIGMPHVSETRGCPSHIDPAYRLTTAIMAKEPFTKEKAYLLPHPPADLKYEGRIVPPYDRYAQTVSFARCTIANIHTEPLAGFGLNYESGEGNALAQEIDGILSDNLARPLLFAADFNMMDLSRTLPTLIGTFDLHEALPDEPTKPSGKRPDHILYSPEWRILDSGVVRTQSDHYLCWGEFELLEQ